MDPFVLDSREIRRLFIDEIVDYANEDIQPNSSLDHQSESDDPSKENLYENTDYIMEDEDQSEPLIDRLRKVIELNLMKFLEMQQYIHLPIIFLNQKSWIGD